MVSEQSRVEVGELRDGRSTRGTISVVPLWSLRLHPVVADPPLPPSPRVYSRTPMPLTDTQVRNQLRNVNDPELHKDIVTLGMVKDVRIDGDRVALTIELTTPACPMKDVIERDVKGALAEIGAADVAINFTAQTRGADKAKSALPQVKNIVAVGAGKGGVGKSTVAVNRAVALQRAGASVGLMDGDIYGPSLPTMLGVTGQVPSVIDLPGGRKIRPMAVHGIHAISIGSLVEAEKPLIWRGPMAHAALKQLLLDNTHWPELDYLIVDLPPGTGDVPLTLCQIVQVTGAVVVATPQQVALDDATRAVRMFQQLGAPILGVVENMSYFVTPDGAEHDVFGRGGTRAMADRMGLPFLGELPMFPELRVNSDSGKPHANFEGNAKLRAALESIAGRLAGEVSKANDQIGVALSVE
jgi:ATP-binding protein involved in chromosome partitioning